MVEEIVCTNNPPDLVGKHIFEQLDAVGLRSVFDRGTTPYVLPYTFSPEED